MTRAAALRMIHAGAVAASPEELDAWIARTDDLRERLTNGGYGSAFTAQDLFPLYESYVAKATTVAKPAPSAAARPAKWLWIAAILVVLAIIVGTSVILSAAS